jgi:hypothetical protein
MFPILQPQKLFTPFSAPGLFAWYHANNVNGNNTNPVSGSAITSWVDLSLNGYDFNETGSNTIFTENLQNGHPGIVFNTASNLQSVLAFLQKVQPGQFTIYIVMKALTGNDTVPLQAVTDILANRFSLIVPFNVNLNVIMDFGNALGGNRLSVLESNIFSNTFAHCFQINTPTMSLYQNNVLMGTNSGAGTFNPAGKVPRLGLVGANGALTMFEVLCYNAIHDATIMAQIQSYFNNYWRLT